MKFRKPLAIVAASSLLFGGATLSAPEASAVPIFRTALTSENVSTFSSLSDFFRGKIEERLFDLPTQGVLTSPYGPRWGTFHFGIDIANRVGTPIYAPADGVVQEAGWVSGYGQWIRLGHTAHKVDTGYGHLNRILVSPGQFVKRGQQIGEMGNTGFSTGPHLHFEVLQGDARIDPLMWMRQKGVDINALRL